MTDTHAVVTKIQEKLAEQTTEVGAIKTILESIPGMITDAVDRALAANPNLTPEDFVALTQVAEAIENNTETLQTAALQGTPSDPNAGGGSGGASGGDGGGGTTSGSESPVEGPPGGEVVTLE